jgi:hypothetical protein
MSYEKIRTFLASLLPGSLSDAVRILGTIVVAVALGLTVGVAIDEKNATLYAAASILALQFLARSFVHIAQRKLVKTGTVSEYVGHAELLQDTCGAATALLVAVMPTYVKEKEKKPPSSEGEGAAEP